MEVIPWFGVGKEATLLTWLPLNAPFVAYKQGSRKKQG